MERKLGGSLADYRGARQLKEETKEVRYLPKRADGSLEDGKEYRSQGGVGEHVTGQIHVVAGGTFRCTKEKLEQLRRDFGGTFEEVVHTKAATKSKKTKKVRGLHTK
jgi:hypothetical protein